MALGQGQQDQEAAGFLAVETFPCPRRLRLAGRRQRLSVEAVVGSTRCGAALALQGLEALVACSSLAGRVSLPCRIPGSSNHLSSCTGSSSNSTTTSSSSSLVAPPRLRHPLESLLRGMAVVFRSRGCHQAYMASRRKCPRRLWGSSNHPWDSSRSSGPLNSRGRL